ncbi:hypothetical protein ACFYT4_16875 [Streptomyces sp. NPDC004609]
MASPTALAACWMVASRMVASWMVASSSAVGRTLRTWSRWTVWRSRGR